MQNMADINTPVSFEDGFQNLISEKLQDAEFTHKSWSDNDLQTLRSHIRNHYRTQQRGVCAYCKKSVSLQSASNCHVEHIAPKSKYPKFIFEPKNLCVACADCNEIKREQEILSEEPDTVVDGDTRVNYPRSSGAFFIVHPHFDTYDEHIQIFNGHYVDVTKKGHFTIGACKLNRRLQAFGWEEEIINEPEISSLMHTFLGEGDAVVKSEALQKLKRKLVVMS